MNNARVLTIAMAVTTLTALLMAGSAPATILEVGGATKSESVTLTASLKAGTSAILKDTFNFPSNICTESHAHGNTTSPFTGPSVTGPLSAGETGLTFKKCERESVVVHASGSLHVTHIAGTTNGTVASSGAKVTTGSPFGTITCETGAGTHLGTLTGSAAGHASLVINAQFSCSGISSRWTATYDITTPTGLGVSADPTSATATLELGGVKQNKSVSITATLKSGASLLLQDTSSATINSCTGSEVVAVTDSPFTGTAVAGEVDNLAFSDCTSSMAVHNGGALHVEHLKNSTNGTVRSSGVEVTSGGPFGTINCKTGAGTHLGTLTGTVSSHATLHINAAISCGGISSRWTGTYTVTSPTGLGVSV